MFQDLKYALRLLRKTPLFTCLTIFVMAIGLGLTIYMFAVVNLLAYKTLDITHYDRLVVIDATENGFQNNGGTIFPHDYFYFKQRQKSYEIFSAYNNVTANLSNGEATKRYAGAMMEVDAFKLFDGVPALGRTFNAQDMLANSPKVAIISHQIWQDDFVGQADIIGQQVQLNGELTSIIGVMPPDYAYPVMEQVWMPLSIDKNAKPGLGWPISVAARLKPDVNIESAQQELANHAHQLSLQYPESNARVGIHTRSPVMQMMDNSMMIVYMLTGATVFILLLVIANVGNLMLARAMERTKEVAIRSALGASRQRIIMQMIMETLIICVVGGFLGIFIAGWGLDATHPIFQNLGGWVANWWQFKLGTEELIAALWIIVGTSILTGVVPAIRASGGDINSILRDGTRGAQGKKAGRLSKILVSVEVFLSCSLLIVAGTMVFGTQQALNADYGINTQGFLTARFGLNDSEYPDTAARYQFHQQLIAGLSRQDNVAGVTIGSAFPGRGSGRQPIQVEGLEVQNNSYARSYFMTVANNYFEVLGVPILEGRAFDQRDTLDSQQVVIVSQSFASRMWPNSSALGKRIKADPSDPESDWLTIVGVSKHLLHAQPFGDAPNRTAVYVPNAQWAYGYQYVAIKTRGNPDDLRNTLKRVAAKVSPNVPFYDVFSLQERLSRRVAGINFVGDLFVIFAVMALILAAAGIYGVMNRNVIGRTQEFGVRRALGATERDILGMIFRQASVLLLFGVVSGAIAGYLGVQALSGTLMNLVPYYLGVTLVVVTLISLTFVMATAMPARHALALEPNCALRYE
ncbi:ADOP family duplicated permease [uncultured Paraglaciecola sp.]|uniref:ADOP family duplicated permease n=1 Tax=uncultured Paraglaciecola sp. TaxID=1765024 RepID=UPI00262F807F|nr:ADOP family duplicated permease [uncultured Paraglaciecola sp.]